MRTIELHQVDAFTDQLFGGNAAGVVTNAEGLSVEDMQNIAREMNKSETAFVLPASDPNADFRLRFFTPSKAEIDFCGHATVGALAQLAWDGRLAATGAQAVTVETKAQTLPMHVSNQQGNVEVSFTAPTVEMETYPDQGEVFARRLGIPPELIDVDSSIMIDRKLRYLYIPTASLEQLQAQSFDFDHIRQEFTAEEIVVFCLFTNQTFQKTADLHARGLAPLVGVDEDPFTGSMQAGLVAAAKHNKYIPREQQTVRTEQGHVLDRPGQAVITHDHAADSFVVTARAVPAFSGIMKGL